MLLDMLKQRLALYLAGRLGGDCRNSGRGAQE